MSIKIGNVENTTNTVSKKRGRKSKKEIEEAKKKLLSDTNNITENVVVKMEETQLDYQNNNNNYVDEILNSNDNDNNNDNNITISNTDNKPVAKKRGRKPKGGKIIQQIVSPNKFTETKPNVILHLKCSLKDLSLSSNLTGYDLNSCVFSNSKVYHDGINTENVPYTDITEKLPGYEIDNDNNNDNDDNNTDFDIQTDKNKENDIKVIWKKLKILQHNLHINNTNNKKSACFWDTCEFDNPPVYIPKHFINDTYHVYGCFCSPECAVAYLMEENIDSSIKFERYQMINHIYSKIYNYNMNIKPSPNPYYMLEKYYGNLTTQEYRSLLRNERLFLIVDKPLTRIMPELHEDNDDFIINNKIIPTNNIKLRKIQKKTKNNILNEQFGFTK
jgi:hypothetical protein